MHIADISSRARRALPALLLVASAGAIVLACSSESGSTPAPLDATVPAADAAPEMLEGWEKITPGGDTRCSDGSEYSFYVRRGTANRMVINFEGGGACWDAYTCNLPDVTYTAAIQATAFPWVGYSKAANIPGIFNQTRPESTFKDWTMVHVPYCTGDLHWGQSDKTYTNKDNSTRTVFHRGAANTKAALAYAYAQVAAPEKVFVTGESAGGYGAAMWAPYVRKQYGTGTKVYQLSDCSAGVIADGFFSKLQDAWNFQATLPNFVPAFADPNQVKTLADVFNGISAYEGSAMSMNMFNTAYDETQTMFYQLQTGPNTTAELWNQKMRAQVASIEATSPTFRAFTAPGFVHVIMTRSAYYTQKTNGVTMRDWVNDLVNDVPLKKVDCATSNSCGEPKQPAPAGDAGAPTDAGAGSTVDASTDATL